MLSELQAALQFDQEGEESIPLSQFAVPGFVLRYYPQTAVTARVFYNNDYNDEYYTPRVRYLAVYDAQNKELWPLEATADECRLRWENLNTEATRKAQQGDGLEDPAEDEIIVLRKPTQPKQWPKLFKQVAGAE